MWHGVRHALLSPAVPALLPSGCSQSRATPIEGSRRLPRVLNLSSANLADRALKARLLWPIAGVDWVFLEAFAALLGPPLKLLHQGHSSAAGPTVDPDAVLERSVDVPRLR